MFEMRVLPRLLQSMGLMKHLNTVVVQMHTRACVMTLVCASILGGTGLQFDTRAYYKSLLCEQPVPNPGFARVISTWFFART